MIAKCKSYWTAKVEFHKNCWIFSTIASFALSYLLNSDLSKNIFLKKYSRAFLFANINNSIINIFNYNKILDIVIQFFFYYLFKNDATKIVIFVFNKMYNLNILLKTCSFKTIFNFTILFKKINWIAYFKYNFKNSKYKIVY